MKRIIFIFALVFGALTGADAQNVNNVTWQTSEAASVKLGVRDKNAILGRYEATFIITGPDHQKYEKTIFVAGDDWGYVSFPDDFNIGQPSGRFSWVCNVRGKVILKGAFVLDTSPSAQIPRRRR